jgi:hypothetical protein
MRSGLPLWPSRSFVQPSGLHEEKDGNTLKESQEEDKSKNSARKSIG